MKFQRGAVFVRQGLHAVQKAPALRFSGCAGESGGGITVSRRYEIYEEDTGNVVKTGISGQKLNADGSSPRANVQVNALNRKENRNAYNAYRSRVVMRDMPTRADALEWEQQNTNRLVAEKNSMCHHKRPTPKLPNNTK